MINADTWKGHDLSRYHSLQTALQKQEEFKFHLNFLRLGLPPFLIFKKRKNSL